MAQCLPLQRYSSLVSCLDFFLKNELISGQASKQKFRVVRPYPTGTRFTQILQENKVPLDYKEQVQQKNWRFLFCGLFCGLFCFFFFPTNPTGDTDREPGFCCFDFCSFSPCPAEALRTHEAKEPLTCFAAPALPSLPEHAGRLQQLRERGQVFSCFSPEPGDCGRVRLCARAWACNQG